SSYILVLFCLLSTPPPPSSPLFPYTTLFRSPTSFLPLICHNPVQPGLTYNLCLSYLVYSSTSRGKGGLGPTIDISPFKTFQNWRSEEHTSELQSRFDLVCRLLLEKKKKDNKC